MMAGSEQRLVAAAVRGDEEAFGRLLDPHRRELHAHCYRMLGSVHDADDALQDTLLRAWRGLAGFEGARPIRPWLYRIATNASLDVLAKRRRRVLPLDHGPPAAPDEGPGTPPAEVLWLEPYPDEQLADGRAAPEARYEQRESVELAFVAALQHLPARQRAVLILREVLGFSAREVAETLETTVASVNSVLQRARKTVEERLPSHSQQETLRDVSDAELRDLVARYVGAWERRDIDAMVAMLVEDATFAMPPHPRWWQGRDAVIGFLRRTGTPDLRHVVLSASAQPAVAWYLRDEERGSYGPASLEVLAVEDGRVRDIVAFVSPELFARFGLPAELSPRGARAP